MAPMAVNVPELDLVLKVPEGPQSNELAERDPTKGRGWRTGTAAGASIGRTMGWLVGTQMGMGAHMGGLIGAPSEPLWPL